MDRFRLRLKSLRFISAVDVPAQETATVVLTKSKDGPVGVQAIARVVKTADELGLVFGWALTSKSAGAEYWDLQGDHIVEDDLVKVAADFLAAGGETDEMHNREADGKVVFCMPLTAEVAKAFGIQTETTGLMVAIKPSPEVFAKFKSGELAGFSIDGTGERKKEPTATAKRAALTTATLGHTHLLGQVDDCNAGNTSSERMPGTGGESFHDSYHSHPWVRRDDGLIEIGESMGHTHEVSTTNATEKQKSSDKSSPSIEAAKVNDMKPVVLTESQFAHFKTLSDADGEAFLAKSFGDRDADVAKALAADPIVFTGELTKMSVRKSDGDLALKLAKQGEEQAVALKAANDMVAVEKAARELVELTKRANDTLGGLAGSDQSHVDLMRAVESISDATKRESVIATLKSCNAIMVAKSKPAGIGGSGEPTNGEPLVVFNAAVKKFADDNGIKDLGVANERFLGTTEGQVAKKAYDSTRAYGKQN